MPYLVDLTRYVKLRVAHAPGMPGTFSRHRLQRKPLVSDPGMHHGMCVTHVPWCMSGSITFPAHAQPVNLRILQEAHSRVLRVHVKKVVRNRAVLWRSLTYHTIILIQHQFQRHKRIYINAFIYIIYVLAFRNMTKMVENTLRVKEIYSIHFRRKAQAFLLNIDK